MYIIKIKYNIQREIDTWVTKKKKKTYLAFQTIIISQTALQLHHSDCLRGNSFVNVWSSYAFMCQFDTQAGTWSSAIILFHFAHCINKWYVWCCGDTCQMLLCQTAKTIQIHCFFFLPLMYTTTHISLVKHMS